MLKVFVIFLLIVIIITSCNGLFEYSPYDTNVSQSNLNDRNIREIKPVEPGDTLWFAVLADVHIWFNQLADAVALVNKLNDISFVVVVGDITDAGLAREFEWYYQIMEKLNVPYVTIIGNHDHLSNGAVIYEKMFGPHSFTFDVGPYHFIGFDDNVWEKGNIFPDFQWLNEQLRDTSTTIQVVFSHIPFWGDQLVLDTAELKNLIYKRQDKVLHVHGHLHQFYQVKMNTDHIVAGDLNDHELCVIGIHDTTFTLKRIRF